MKDAILNHFLGVCFVALMVASSAHGEGTATSKVRCLAQAAQGSAVSRPNSETISLLEKKGYHFGPEEDPAGYDYGVEFYGEVGNYTPRAMSRVTIRQYSYYAIIFSRTSYGEIKCQGWQELDSSSNPFVIFWRWANLCDNGLSSEAFAEYMIKKIWHKFVEAMPDCDQAPNTAPSDLTVD